MRAIALLDHLKIDKAFIVGGCMGVSVALAMKLPAFIMSGDDASHSASSVQALRELLPDARLSPLMPPAQNAATVAAWLREARAAVQ